MSLQRKKLKVGVSEESTSKAIRHKIKSALGDVAGDSKMHLGDVRQDEYQKRSHSHGEDDERQAIDGDNRTLSKSNGDQLQQKSLKQKKNSKGRNIFIQKGRERVRSARRGIVEIDDAVEPDVDIANLESFSIDDGSYIDDLRLSILAEDWEMDPRNYQSKARRQQHQQNEKVDSEKPNWEELLSKLESSDSDDRKLRDIILDVAAGQNRYDDDKSGSPSDSVKSTERQKTVKSTPQSSQSEARTASRLQKPPMHHTLASWGRKQEISSRNTLSAEADTEVSSGSPEPFHSEKRQHSSEEVSLPLTPINHKESRRVTLPRLRNARASLRVKTDSEPTQQKAMGHSHPQSRREEVDDSGGARPVVRNRRTLLSPSSQQPMKAMRPKEDHPIDEQFKEAATSATPNEIKKRTHERLQYLKTWLREREHKHESRIPSTPSTRRVSVISKPIENHTTEKRPTNQQIQAEDVELKQSSKEDSLHSAPSLDEYDGHRTRIQHRKPINLNGIEVSLIESESDGSFEGQKSANEIGMQTEEEQNAEGHKPSFETSLLPIDSRSEAVSTRTRDLLARSRTLFNKSIAGPPKPKVVEYIVSPASSFSRDVVWSASDRNSKQIDIVSSDTLASNNNSTEILNTNSNIPKKAEILTHRVRDSHRSTKRSSSDDLKEPAVKPMNTTSLNFEKDDSMLDMRSCGNPDDDSNDSSDGGDIYNSHGSTTLPSSRVPSTLPYKGRQIRHSDRLEYLQSRDHKVYGKMDVFESANQGPSELINDMVKVSSSLTESLPPSQKANSLQEANNRTTESLGDHAERTRTAEAPEDDIQTAEAPEDQMTSQKKPNPLYTQVTLSAPRLRKSSRAFVNPDGDNSVDLSVSYKNEHSFESLDFVKVDDLPIWRLDPLESLSDFIIQIQNEESGETSIYHVHKQILAFGPQRSMRLDSIFRSSTVASTNFVLGNKAASFFPFVLDFLYFHDYELQFETDNALVYRNLAKTFQVTSLMAAATTFIEQDMQISNMATYVTEISAYKDISLRKLVQAKCAENIELISEMDSLWILMDPELFWGTISCPLIDRNKTSPYLSILVKEYTSLHMHEMDEATFDDLTSPSILPIIDRQAALPLLEICFSYGSPKAFEPLQKRCALTMASYWKITSETDRQRLFALLRNFPSSFTVDFLERVETGNTISLVNTSRTLMSQNSVSIKSKESLKAKEFSLGVLYDDFGDNDDDHEDDIERAILSATRKTYLSWRIQPDLSFSDWKIRVKHTNSGRLDVYNVHKHVLAVGQYKSSFFSDIFLSRKSEILSKDMTTVELNHTAAELLPQMLDFVYSMDHTIKISTEIAVALRFLARAFRVWMLNKEVIDFIHEDLSMSNALQYIEDSDSFNDEVVTEMTILYFATNIAEIDVDSPLLHSLEPGFFGRVVSSEAIDSSNNCHVAILMVKFFVIHELDESLLEDMLKQSDMDGLDCLNALKLLQIICALKSKSSEFFLSLKVQCTEVLKENWSELRETFRNELFIIFQTLDTDTVAMLFEKVEENYYEKVYKTTTEQSKLLNNYKSQLVDVKDEHEAEVTKVKQELEEKVQEIVAKKKDLEKELKEKDDEQAKITDKKIPMIIGAVSSLSEDSKFKTVVEKHGFCSGVWCGPVNETDKNDSYA